jgi:hypothetical protein
MANYFTKDTDELIKQFIEATDSTSKHQIFESGIRRAFEKLIENLIYVYRFYSLDDPDVLKADCLSVLYESLPKYDPERGTKGFSYFNVVAKNWFIMKTRENSKKRRIEKELHVDVDKDAAKTNPAMTYGHHEEQVLEKEFWASLFSELDHWREKFSKPNERKVLEAVIFLIRNSELVPIYNKKAVYMYIREMTGLNEKQMSMILKKMRDQYVKWKLQYFDGELE